jgi:hypothetical protein
VVLTGGHGLRYRAAQRAWDTSGAARGEQIPRARPGAAMPAALGPKRRRDLRGRPTPPGLIETLALRDVTARVAPFPVDEARRAATDEFSLLGTREDLGARLELCANW